MRPLRFAAMLTGLLWLLSGHEAMAAPEAACTALGSNCVCSDTFQSTSYSVVAQQAGIHAVYIGDQVGDKPCHWGDIVATGTAASIHWTYGAGDTLASMLQISTDSSILNLLPNRNVTDVARFLRSQVGVSALRFGEAGMDLSTMASRRLEMRWYSYHSSDYEWAGDGSCTNGKIAHNSNDYQQAALMTLTLHGGATAQSSLYTFLNSWNWLWSGHSSFEGFNSKTGPRPGSAVDAHGYRGKWFRHSVVISNPKSADAGGYDFQYFVKNITDGTAEVEDVRFSAGCTNCMAVDGPDFTWDTSIHPSNNMNWLHTEFYRAGTCLGWQGWTHLMIASWTTNAEQRIAAASEVEGGSSTTNSVINGRGRVSGAVRLIDYEMQP